MALPNLVVIGAMKCGTTSLHHYLDQHPQIRMAQPKELDFFSRNWERGLEWYGAHFDAAAPVRGEVSPGYTSPSFPYAAERMAAVVPDARLLYAVRDPVRRAVSQYRHHRREGTEHRDLETALLDPASQYVARGRYFERLAPFLATAAFDGRIEVVAQERLRASRREVLRRLFALLGVDDGFWTGAMDERRNESPDEPPEIPARLRARLVEAFRDDADRLREFTGEEFPDWSV